MSERVAMTPVDRDEQAALWCLSLAEGVLSAEERTAFDRWIADPLNAAAFDEVTQLWNGAEAIADTPELIHVRGQALKSLRKANERRWADTRTPSWPQLAVLAASLLIGLFLFLALRDPVDVLSTGVGERRVAVLTDGSRISLDADSIVEVRLRDDRRDLRLVAGRAMFSVAKDPLRPFSVSAGDKMVVATGTTFSVELLRSQVRVLLYEGRVAMLDRRTTRPVPQQVVLANRTLPADQLLTPGHELVVAPEGGALATVAGADLARSLLWESGQLSFDDEPLASAVERMNRYSTTKLAVSDRTANIRINGVYTAGDVDAFVEGVTMLNPVRVARAGESTLLVSR